MENLDEARKLCRSLVRRNRFGHVKLRVEVRLDGGKTERYALTEGGRTFWASRTAARIVFAGGKFGEHSIDAWVSDETRVRAHFEGYAAASDMLQPKIDQIVGFPSGSARSGFRCGRVLRVGPRRALIKFKYKHGGESERWVPLTEIRFMEVE